MAMAVRIGSGGDVRRTTGMVRALAFGFLLLAGARCGAAEDLDLAAWQLRVKHTSSIQQLAEWCRAQGLNDQAEKTLACLGPTDPYKLYLPVIPKQVASPPPADAPAAVLEWDARLKNLRRDQANALYDLSRRAVRGGRAALGYDLLVAAIRENPDHEAIRRLLGFQKRNGQWCTPYEVRKLRDKMVWHPQFGWLLQSHVHRYQQGQRYNNGKWISAEEDARLHQDIRNGWDIETEHYTIRTNHSLEGGVALVEKLERLYRVWQQLFVRFYATEPQVVAMFEGKQSTPLVMPRHQVFYFRDQPDYNRALRLYIPNVEQTIGAYLQQTRRANFFAAKLPDDRTLYHEATHQLFHESRPVAPDVARRGNFWVVEGVAMYLESLREENGFCVLGGTDDLRMNAAAVRLLRDNFYVPLAEFTAYGMSRLQSDPRIATLYSQAAGLTHFLMHAHGGRYRDALVAYLYTVYNGRDEPGTLSALTGKPYVELDRQYRQFVTDAVQAATRPTPK